MLHTRCSNNSIVKNWSLFRKQSPEAIPAEVPEGIRGSPAADSELCILCGICTKVCPSGALVMTKADKDNGKIILDRGRCLFCSQCEASCPKNCIIMTDQWNIPVLKREDSFVTFVHKGNPPEDQ